MIAMWYYRMDIGLEPHIPRIDITFPSFNDCPENIADEFFTYEELIGTGLNAVSDLDKMEKFLKDVDIWIRAQPSTGTGNFSKTGHGFSPEDNEECMASFNNIEQTYLDNMIEKARVADEFDALYGDILDKKGDYRFVDNELFLRWVGSYQEYPSDAQVPNEIALPQFVLEAFLSDEGAKQIET